MCDNSKVLIVKTVVADTSSDVEVAIRKLFHGSMSSWLTQRKASDGACVIDVSANAWMILLMLLSNFSSFSTFWTYGLHMLLEGRHSPLLHLKL